MEIGEKRILFKNQEIIKHAKSKIATKEYIS
jgi:hypothetical protein